MIGIASMGAGPMARTHAKAISAAGGRLITVYDVVESAAKSSHRCRPSVAHSPKKALDRPDVAAVLVDYDQNVARAYPE
jgi:predicted dehydrogenase